MYSVGKAPVVSVDGILLPAVQCNISCQGNGISPSTLLTLDRVVPFFPIRHCKENLAVRCRKNSNNDPTSWEKSLPWEFGN